MINKCPSFYVEYNGKTHYVDTATRLAVVCADLGLTLACFKPKSDNACLCGIDNLNMILAGLTVKGAKVTPACSCQVANTLRDCRVKSNTHNPDIQYSDNGNNRHILKDV